MAILLTGLVIVSVVLGMSLETDRMNNAEAKGFKTTGRVPLPVDVVRTKLGEYTIDGR